MYETSIFLLVIFVISLLLAIYGGYLLIYNLSKGNDFQVIYLVLMIIGIVMLIIYFVLSFISSRKKKAEKIEPTPEMNTEPIEEKEEIHVSNKTENSKPVRRDYEYVRSRESVSIYDNDSGGTSYIKLVGYGPVLRVSGNRILDMRSNTYYRIQGDKVYEEGSGILFEINGNRIRDAFGGYLFEISGSNINKTFGGFFASISGNYINKYDLSEKYEMSSSLSTSQLLVVAALLFNQK